jgi:hypothetical protein
MLTMNEKEFGDALLRLDAAARPPADARALTDRILARDRRRVRILIWLTVGSWLLSAVLVLFLLVAFGLMFPAMAKLREDKGQNRGTPGATAPPAGANPTPQENNGQNRLTPVQREQMQHDLEIAFKLSTVFITFTVGALSLAGLCTLGLVLATRRATLRQVNANLVEITEQLKQLRQERTPPAAAP